MAVLMVKGFQSALRKWLGVAILEYPSYRRVLAAKGRDWIGLCNRRESTSWSPERAGVACNWEWTSQLHAPSIMPHLRKAMFARALSDFSFELVTSPRRRAMGGPVDVSFVIGHRGLERLPLLLATLKSIAAQEGVSVECIVVEQSAEMLIFPALPEWVSYVHTPPPVAGMPYARSWAFNVGALRTSGRLLIFHDNDLLVPVTYAAEHLKVIDSGYDAANLKRFIFYMNEQATQDVTGGRGLADCSGGVECILQNALGGGSLAIDRNAFFEIGGFDEDFVGWGGEDNEIWDRVLTRSVYRFGHLPLIHLWHSPQPGKMAVRGRGIHTAELVDRRREIAPEERINELKERVIGNLEFSRYVSK